MKKIFKLFLALTFAFTVFATVNATVNAEEHDNGEAPTDRKVVVHYHRWDGDYENVNLWTWDTGTNGSEAPILQTEPSDFGAAFEIYVDDDAADEIGLIIRFDMGWGNGQNDRDGLRDDDAPDGDIPNKFITIKEDGDFVGFDEDGVKHVFVYEGMADVIYQDDLYGPLREDTGTLAVIFYDPDEYSEVAEYDIWTWGYGLEDELEPVPFQGILGVQAQLESQAMFRVAHIPIGADADDEIGIIFRTAGVWGEFQTDDLSADVSDIKGGGFKTVFFGMENQFDTFEQFENFAMPATIEAATALDPGSILVEFNKGITVLDGEEEIFDPSWFTVYDKDDNEVTIDRITFTQGQASVEEFMLQFDEADLNAADAPYTVVFQSDPEDEETRTEFVVEISDTPPTIRIVGSTNPQLELGDEYSLPSFSATELLDDESRPLYNVLVKEGHGYLSTREPGVYEIVIEAADTFGNRSEETITVTVTDPCDAEAHLSAGANQNLIIGAAAGIAVLLAGITMAMGGNKKFFSLALSLILLVGIAACGREPACENRADEGVEYFFDQDQTETVTITLWLDDEDYASAIIEAFEAQNPGIRVRFSEVGSVDVRQQLELYSGSRAAADVVMFPHDHIGAALQSNLLYNIEGSLEMDLRERMILSATETASACYDFDTNRVIDCEGDAERYLFGAPLSGESLALFYNRELLEELTGSSEPATSFEEIIAQFEQYQDILESDYADLMLALDVGNAYDMHFIATSFGYQLFGPDGLDSDAANLDSEEMIAALTFMNETLRPALNNFDSGDLDGESNRSKFEAGNLPYIVDGPWSIARYRNAGLDFGVTQLPTIDGNQPVTFSGVQMLAVYSQTDNPDAAFRLLEFMTSAEGLEIMYDITNQLPALEDVSVIDGLADDEYLTGISDQLNYSVPMPIIPEMGFFWDNAGAMYGAAWNGTLTPEEAAKEAQEGFDGSR